MAGRKHKCEPGGAGFLTTYADIVTLLMAFFVLLFAISSVDQVKFLALLKGLEEDFGNTSYQNYVVEGSPAIIGSNQPSGSLIPSTGGPISIIPIPEATELIEIAAASGAGDSGEGTGEPGETENPPDPVTDTVAANVLDLTGLLAVEESLVEAADQLGLRGAVTTEFRERGLVIALSTDDLLFRSGSAELEGGLGRELIAALAAVIEDFDNPVFVEGHTDNVPLNRPDYDNWNLSADRANAVVKAFEREFGIAGSRLSGTGRSYFHPLGSNDTEDGRAMNRRVELVIGLNPGDLTLVVDGREVESGTSVSEVNNRTAEGGAAA